MNADTATAFLVPSTTRRREWSSIEETYLYSILLKTLNDHPPPVDISIFVGYDDDDPIYSKEEERLKLNSQYLDFNIIWVPFTSEPGNVVRIWNGLCIEAMKHGFQWFKILGDDIRLPNDPSWVRVFQKQLKKQNYIGWAAGWSNNDQIATQFMIHKTHWQIFEFVYPPAIKNWYCDDWMFEIYPESYRYLRRDYPLLNVGGNPRYDARHDRKLCDALLRRHKKDVPEFLNMISKIKK